MSLLPACSNLTCLINIIITAVFIYLQNSSENFLDVASIWKCKVRAPKTFSCKLRKLQQLCLLWYPMIWKLTSQPCTMNRALVSRKSVILNIKKNLGLPDTPLPSPVWCQSWCECSTWPSLHHYKHRSLIYSQATQPATHHIPWQNPGAAPLVLWCKSVTNHTYTLFDNSSSLTRMFQARLWSTMIVCLQSTWITLQILCLTQKCWCLVMRHTKMREHLIGEWGGLIEGQGVYRENVSLGGRGSQSKFYIVVGWKYEDKLLGFLCLRLLYLAFGTLGGWIDSKLSNNSSLKAFR